MEPKSAGDLRNAVRIERRADSSDGAGGTKTDWETLIAERDCQLTPTRGGESIQAQRNQGTVQFDCWMRCDDDTLGITADDRAVDLDNANRTFNITPVGDMTGKGQWLLFQFMQGVADG